MTSHFLICLFVPVLPVVSLAMWKKALIAVFCMLLVVLLVLFIVMRYKAKRGRETYSPPALQAAHMSDQWTKLPFQLFSLSQVKERWLPNYQCELTGLCISWSWVDGIRGTRLGGFVLLDSCYTIVVDHASTTNLVPNRQICFKRNTSLFYP